ncbi:amidase [Alteromonas pelagimontana]|uniref:Amidase n=1 Tax=Alteromonas pelagimontana TaxID=1858656 RepID=A0A6M4M8K9_9ALTE|nr:amidase [Alteromonas pelagimontana]QJR79532.1 amidase [Alteromonas pelagimontana]
MNHHQSSTPFMPGSQQQVKLFSAAHRRATGQLSNLRLAVKDLFHIQGIPTTAGNPAWASSHPIPEQTSSAVQKLLDAGAEFVGKTLTDELAYSLEGRNIHFGTLINPQTPLRLSGGSSSGSAVAVASKLADIGLGTDTGGSIRVPASYNGLYGLRPTHGVIAMDSTVPLAPPFDTVGWMTRDLDTMAKVANIYFHAALPQRTRFTLGVADNLLEESEHGSEILQWLREHTFSKAIDLKGLSLPMEAWKPGQTFRILQGHAIIGEHGEWLSRVKPAIASDIQTRLDWCRTITESDVVRAQKQRDKIAGGLATLFKHYDVLVIPTTPGRAPLLDTPEDALNSYRNQLLDFTAIAGLGGLPQLHIPACLIDGAPCGLSLVGIKNSDLSLLAMAQRLTE